MDDFPTGMPFGSDHPLDQALGHQQMNLETQQQMGQLNQLDMEAQQHVQMQMDQMQMDQMQMQMEQMRMQMEQMRRRQTGQMPTNPSAEIAQAILMGLAVLAWLGFMATILSRNSERALQMFAVLAVLIVANALVAIGLRLAQGLRAEGQRRGSR